MLTGKQRAYLKALAHDIEPVVYIGKDELTDNVVAEMDRYLAVHELVKVKIQDGCEANPKDLANECASSLHAEYVQAIGKRFVLYRKARKPENRKIELPK